MRMDDGTIRHYERDASALAARYESADMSETHALLVRHPPPKGRVLEVGCGSGRDAAFLASQGFDVTALDGAEAMVSSARRLHPESELSMPSGAPLGNSARTPRQRYRSNRLAPTKGAGAGLSNPSSAGSPSCRAASTASSSALSFSG